MNLKKRFRSVLAETFELPKEILFDLPRVTLIGNLQLYIQNHRGIVEYTDEVIKISINGGELIIKGDNLVIKNVFSDEIFIEGNILSVGYEV